MEHRFSTFEELVGFYESYLQLPLLKELAVCHAAANSSFDNRRKAEILLMGGHQWHLKMHSTQQGHIIEKLAETKLWERDDLNFEEIYMAVVEAIGGIRYAGELTLYDVAKRIGSCCGREPEQVYLHSGARIGAKRLLGIERLSYNKLSVDVFRNYFPTLSALHIENILCIFKSYFKKGAIDKDVEENFSRCCFKCYFEIPEEFEYIMQAKTVAELQIIIKPQTK